MNKKKRINKKSMRKKNLQVGGKSINVPSKISTELQWNSPNQASPPAPHNGGLYSGAAFNGPWLSISTNPTTENMINKNLKSAVPPPRATTQYQLTVKPGNNYQAMKGVDWYTQSKGLNPGPFKLQVASGKKSKKNFKNKIGKKKSKINKKKNSKINKKNHVGGNKDYSVNIESVVPLKQQWNSPRQQAPKPPYNGGLYTGAAFNGPWGNIPVTPTADSMMKNMKSASPPPKAEQQTPNLNRIGNNYSGMQDISWYNPSNGPFKMQVISKGGSKKKKKI